ncbi:helix-turn-helix domain-containing protein [Caballeronia glebae]|uniref:helix-turn-helix domain-containing protein n=1 Tax=Caballeronia glebae TaxID=1777143 RepID=UPI000B3568F3
MDIKLLGQLCQRLVALERCQGHLCLERWRVGPSVSFRHLLVPCCRPLWPTHAPAFPLKELSEFPKPPLRKAKIEESIYGWDEEVESNAIEVYVSGLRKKLGMDAIRTIRGVGYVMEKP